MFRQEMETHPQGLGFENRDRYPQEAKRNPWKSEL